MDKEQLFQHKLHESTCYDCETHSQVSHAKSGPKRACDQMIEIDLSTEVKEQHFI